MTNHNLLPAHLIKCPEFRCTATASVVPWTVVWATNGAVPTVKVVCARSHIYYMPADQIPADETVDAEVDELIEVVGEDELLQAIRDIDADIDSLWEAIGEIEAKRQRDDR